MHLAGVSFPHTEAHSADVRALSKADSQKFAAALQVEMPKGGQQVTASRTQLTSLQASSALREAWKAHFGQEPRDETVAVLTAQWSHETGNGQSMFNYNFGGIKGVGPSGMTVVQRTKEGWGESERTIRDGFRAYSSAEEGASDYVSLLKRKYPGAIEAAHQGSPALFVQELKKGGYFTGNPDAYVRSVSSRTEQLLGRSPELSTDAAPQSIYTAPSPVYANVNPQTIARQTGSPLASPIANSSLAPSLSRRSQATSHGPSAMDLNAFDDALSRAALRIALMPHRHEERG